MFAADPVGPTLPRRRRTTETPPNPAHALRAERRRLEAKIEEIGRSPSPTQEARLRALTRSLARFVKAEEKNTKVQAKQENPDLIEARANLAAWSQEIQRLNAERQAAGARDQLATSRLRVETPTRSVTHYKSSPRFRGENLCPMP
jgi:hypothetical protein